jgi:hypothetical protein
MGSLAWGGSHDLNESEFYNRINDIEFISNLLNSLATGSAPTIMLSGVRGVGKTVLIKKIKEELEKDFLIVYMDLTRNYEYQKGKLKESGLMDIFYKSIINECDKNNLSIVKKKIAKEIKTRKFKIDKITEINGLPVPIPESEEDIPRLLEFVLNLPQEIYDSNKKEIKGVIMIIDEFQALKDLGENLNGFLWLLRSVIESQKNVAYLFSGSASSQDKVMQEVSGDKGVFGGRTLTIKVEPFDKETVKNYLNEKLPELILTDDGFDRFYQCTQGIPFYVNSFANLLDKNVPLDDEKIKNGFRKTISFLSDHLKQKWGSLAFREQEIIVSLLDSPLKRNEIGEKINRNPNSLSRPLLKLQVDELLYNEPGGIYSIREPMLRYWLKNEYETKGVIPYRTT